ncbi:MAG: hypothetical protein JNN15_12285 [Blastocatellia bacterium]|nr:hypothetical protein [Blastocatellia bacterium]
MDAKQVFIDLQSGKIDAEEAKRRLFNYQSRASKELDITLTEDDKVVENRDIRETNNNTADDIAIVGINGHFPMASDIDQFWLNLSSGQDSISEIPKDRWNNEAYYSADKEASGKTYCRWGGFIEDVEGFDPLFFNISPRDAEMIDPQERKMLEVVWETLERSGYTRKRIKQQLDSQVGVFIGSMYQQYHAFDAEISKKAMVALSSYGSIANRISYFFNLNGPSIALDTMCSSASTAIDVACHSLRYGNCKMAIVGAANLSIHPYKYVALSQVQMLSSDKDKRSFAAGDGFIPSEVVAAVLLKPLARAEADGDNILALIKSTSVKHKGRSEGFSVPELSSQVSLLQEHFAKSGIAPETISYIESSASGSMNSDSTEFATLKEVFSAVGFRCPVGSVKANIGHAEASSGLAQLAKVVLQLHHQKLVPSIKTEPINPSISFEDSPFYLVETLSDWKQPVKNSKHDPLKLPRRVSINTFGAGGTNCHLIIEEYSFPKERKRIVFPPVFTFSAHKRNSLLLLIRKYKDFLEKQKDLPLSDIAYTLQVGREEMEHRVSVVAHNYLELLNELEKVEKLLDGQKIDSKNIFSTLLPTDLQDSGEENREFHRLAQAWARGEVVEWQSYYIEGAPQILPLPTYTFDRKRYWLRKPEDYLQFNAVEVAETSEERVESLNIQIGRAVAATLSELLALQNESIDWNRSFVELGADSLTLSRLARKIESQFQVKIKNRDFLQYRTVDLLSSYLAKNLTETSTHHSDEHLTKAAGSRF